ncbi:hypothetical protein [Bradyrhizobium sp. 192]|uniref:hypothetical protein n=1 Tax=Bradyrhizobium sp. 192 TaxID=2782660 RepID=UPI001FFE3696|nr:hypothetical protein [Bradyrhizobium sp. 192]UPJ61950.1 hypothetical protein IVB24_08715 [Bradyrhizobium sp. 192]
MSKIGYNGAKVTAVGKLTTLLPAARKGALSETYARSLRNLPKGSMLVVATLPIVDWNDCLLRDFQNVSKGARRHMYTAITFGRPIFRNTWSIYPTRVLQNTGRNWRTCFARQDFVANSDKLHYLWSAAWDSAGTQFDLPAGDKVFVEAATYYGMNSYALFAKL